MRAFALVALVACSGSSGDGAGDDAPPPDPKGWTITVDMAGLNRYATETPWPVGGVVTATEGVASVDVAGGPVVVGEDGTFGAMVDVADLTRVPILARDGAGHERKGDRSVLATRFLPAGDHNAQAAALVLDDAILAAMSGGLVSQAGDVDVAGEILAKPVLSQDDRCTTWPTAATQGAVAVELVDDAGDLWLHIQIPNLDVSFEGQCQGVFSLIPIGGEFGGTLDVWTQLAPHPSGDCLTAFGHSTPEVTIAGWGFDVWGLGGPLQNWIIALFQGDKATEARAQLQSEVGARADQMLAQKLANVTVFDRSSELELLGEPVALHLCVHALDKVGTKLVARIAGAATGGASDAPGAPQIDGAAIKPAAHELVLDANLVGQLLFASWQSGGLTRAAPDADISILQILVPELSDHFTSSTAQVAITAELPPLVRATPDGPGKLSVDIADLMVDLSLEGQRIFRFGVVLHLALDLTASDGKLVPKVLDATAQVSLLDELYDGPDAALEQALQSQVTSVAAQLIGDNAAIALPDLPGLGTPKTVKADPNGRFLHITLQ